MKRKATHAMKLKHLALAFGLALGVRASAQAADTKPNIVLVFIDNFGWGELGVYQRFNRSTERSRRSPTYSKIL
jgi:hypothetical protein